MGALSPILRSVQGGNVGFWCPGCNEMHVVGIEPPASLIWGYNGNPDAPTFTPSVLIRGGHYVPGQEGKKCWCTYNAEHPDKAPVFTCSVCHSFVVDGQIQFLGDCTHALAGQTVAIPNWST